MARRKILSGFFPPDHDHDSCMQGALSRAEQICQGNGTRLTELRRKVLHLIWLHHRPVGAYELLERLPGKRTAAPPTIYRALEFLLEQGLIHRIETLNAYVGCSAPREQHSSQFLICQDCQAVAEVNDPDIQELVHRRASGMAFRVVQQTIEILGQCAQCRRSTS